MTKSYNFEKPVGVLIAPTLQEERGCTLIVIVRYFLCLYIENKYRVIFLGRFIYYVVLFTRIFYSIEMMFFLYKSDLHFM